MTTVVADNPDEERYELHQDGELAAFTEYQLGEGFIAFVHTETQPAFEGHGVAQVLVRETLDDVRRRGLAVMPFCPYVRGFIEKNPEYVDLVPEGERARFDLD